MKNAFTYAFYGSLRRDMYNHEFYKSDLEYQFIERLSGFRLYSLTRYPVAVKTGLTEDRITVEIFRITNPETENKIHQLEIGAGYYLDETVVRGVNAGIFLFRDPQDYQLVSGGDWVKHLEELSQGLTQ